jgi:hypothetical protein
VNDRLVRTDADHDDVGAAVAVEVAGGDAVLRGRRWRVQRRLQRPVAVAEQDREDVRRAAGVAGGRDVHPAVPVEVGRGEVERRRRGEVPSRLEADRGVCRGGDENPDRDGSHHHPEESPLPGGHQSAITKLVFRGRDRFPPGSTARSFAR